MNRLCVVCSGIDQTWMPRRNSCSGGSTQMSVYWCVCVCVLVNQMNPIWVFVCTHKHPSFIPPPIPHIAPLPELHTWNEAKRRHFKRFISSSAATINRSAFIHLEIHCEICPRWRCSPCLYKTYCFLFCLFWIKCDSDVELFSFSSAFSCFFVRFLCWFCVCVSNIRIWSVIELKHV